MFNGDKIKELEEKIQKQRDEFSNIYDRLFKLENQPKYKVGETVTVNMPVDRDVNKVVAGLIVGFKYDEWSYNPWISPRLAKYYEVWIDADKEKIEVLEENIVCAH